MICQSCGMTIGVDCFNPQECMAITQDMALRGEYSAQREDLLAYEIHVRDEHIAELQKRLTNAKARLADGLAIVRLDVRYTDSPAWEYVRRFIAHADQLLTDEAQS